MTTVKELLHDAAPTAKELLQSSLDDIKEGHWCTGVLGDFGLRTTGIDLKIRITDDHLREGLVKDELGVELLDKPMGCAVGLVSTYAGIGEPVHVVVGGVPRELFAPFYPDDKAPKPVWDAMRSLALSVPESSLSRDYKDPDDPYYTDLSSVLSMSTLVDVVTAYNDRIDRNKAEEWFSDALERLG